MPTTSSRAVRAAALLGAGVAAGVVGASALGANAQTTNGIPSSTSALSSSSGSTTATGNHARHGNETAVTGAKAAALKANALKQVPGATVDGVTTEDPAEGTGAAYEVHLTKSDGARQTLLFKSDLTYLSTETRGGWGGHGGRGGRGGRGGFGAHGAGAGETAVTGTKAATLRSEALKRVPGATVDAVTTDSGDAAYEVHLTKTGGTEVTVKFDKNLKFVNVEAGRGK